MAEPTTQLRLEHASHESSPSSGLPVIQLKPLEIEQTQQLVGLSADPAAEAENWEEDFDLDPQPTEEAAPSKLVLTQSEVEEIEKLLSTLPQCELADENLQKLNLATRSECSLKDISRVICQNPVDSDSALADVPHISSFEEQLAEAKAKGDAEEQLTSLISLSRAHRVAGQTASSMLQLQRALDFIESLKDATQTRMVTPQASLASIEAQIHYELSLTARKIQDLVSALAHLNRALVLVSSSITLSPLWSTLWLQLHSDSGELLIVTGDYKAALSHFSQFLAGVLARAPHGSLMSPEEPDDSVSKYYSNIGYGTHYLGAILAESGLHDLAERALSKSAGAYQGVGNEKENTRVLEWLIYCRQQLQKKFSSMKSMESPQLHPESIELDEIEDFSEEDWDKEFFSADDEESKAESPPLRAQRMSARTASSQRPTSTSRFTLLLRGQNKSSRAVDSTPESTIPNHCQVYRSLLQFQQVPVSILKYPKATVLFTNNSRIMSEVSLHEWLSGLFSDALQAQYRRACRFSGAEQAEWAQRLCFVLVGSAAWAELQVEYCFRLYKSGHSVLCWAQIDEFFQGVRACRSQDGNYLSAPFSAMDGNQRRDLSVVCRACHSMLRLAMKLWVPMKQQQFQQFLFIARMVDVGGRAAVAFELLEIESVAFHSNDPHTLQRLVMPALCRINLTSVHRESSGSFQDQEPRSPDVNEIPRMASNGGSGCTYLEEHEIQALAVADLHLSAIGFCPISYSKPAPLKNGSAVSTSGVDPATAQTDTVPPTLFSDRMLSDPDARAAKLYNLYTRLDHHSFLKAKCAFCLGLYELSRKSNSVAESLFFESVYILHRCPSAVTGVSSLVSRLGEASLTYYANTLLLSKKSLYAIVALGAAAQCHLLRTGVAPNFLYRRLTLLCADFGDYRKSFEYYSKLRVEGQMSELLFLSERIADLYFQLGDFSSAETVLMSASNLMVSDSMPEKFFLQRSKLSIVDSRYMRLQLRLARVMLRGPNPARGIGLLEGLLDKAHSISNQGSLNKLLAWGYFLLDRTKECEAVLEQLQQSFNSHGSSTTVDQFWISSLWARNCLQSGNSARALDTLDAAIRRETRVSGLAQLYLLRGKGFMALARFKDPDFARVSPSTASNLAAESFLTSHQYFSEINDKIQAAKAASRYVQARLWRPGVPSVNPQMKSAASWSQSSAPQQPKVSPYVRGTGSRRTIALQDWKLLLNEGPHKKKTEAEIWSQTEQMAHQALDLAASYCGDMKLLLHAHMNLAELYLQQGREKLATAYFHEARDLLFALFVRRDGQFILHGGPSYFTRFIMHLVQRMARYVLAVGPRNYTHVFDLLLHLESILDSQSPCHFLLQSWRVWSLLHQLRRAPSQGFQPESEGTPGFFTFGKDEVRRGNINVLQEVYRITAEKSIHKSGTPSNKPRSSVDLSPGGKPILKSHAVEKAQNIAQIPALEGETGGQGELQPEKVESGSSTDRIDSKSQSGERLGTEALGNELMQLDETERIVYVICIPNEVLAIFCYWSGRLEIKEIHKDGLGSLIGPGEGGVMKSLLLENLAALSTRLDARTVALCELGKMFIGAVSLPGMEVQQNNGSLLQALGQERAPLWVESLRTDSASNDPAPSIQLRCMPCNPVRPKSRKMTPRPAHATPSTQPIVLACCHILRGFSWELVMPSVSLVRSAFFSITNEQLSVMQPEVASSDSVPFVCISQSRTTTWQFKSAAHVHRADVYATWLSDVKRGTEITMRLQADQRVLLSSSIQVRKPFRKAHKCSHIAIFDPGSISTNPNNMVNFINKFKGPMVLLIPYHCLLTLPQIAYLALSHRPDAMIAFAPQGCLKWLSQSINAYKTLVTQHGRKKASYLENPRATFMQAVQDLKENLNVPVVLMTATKRSKIFSPQCASSHASGGIDIGNPTLQTRPHLRTQLTREKQKRPARKHSQAVGSPSEPPSSAENLNDAPVELRDLVQASIPKRPRRLSAGSDLSVQSILSLRSESQATRSDASQVRRSDSNVSLHTTLSEGGSLQNPEHSTTAESAFHSRFSVLEGVAVPSGVATDLILAPPPREVSSPLRPLEVEGGVSYPPPARRSRKHKKDVSRKFRRHVRNLSKGTPTNSPPMMALDSFGLISSVIEPFPGEESSAFDDIRENDGDEAGAAASSATALLCNPINNVSNTDQTCGSAPNFPQELEMAARHSPSNEDAVREDRSQETDFDLEDPSLVSEPDNFASENAAASRPLALSEEGQSEMQNERLSQTNTDMEDAKKNHEVTLNQSREEEECNPSEVVSPVQDSIGSTSVSEMHGAAEVAESQPPLTMVESTESTGPPTKERNHSGQDDDNTSSLQQQHLPATPVETSEQMSDVAMVGQELSREFNHGQGRLNRRTSNPSSPSTATPQESRRLLGLRPCSPNGSESSGWIASAEPTPAATPFPTPRSEGDKGAPIVS